MAASQKQGISIFLRILVVFMAINIATSGILIIIAYVSHVQAIEKRTKETLSQHVATIRDNFEKQYGANLRRTIGALVTASALDEYLLASDAEQLILSKKLERLFQRTITDFESYESISFLDASGAVIINAVRKSPRLLSGHGTEKALATPATQHPAVREAAIRLFHRLESVPLMLSSGYMEWFIPQRDVEIEGPFLDERGTVSSLAALPKLDLDSGTFGGVILIHQNLTTFFAYLRSVKFFDENPVWVFDADGAILQRPDKEQVTFNPSNDLPQTFHADMQLLDTKRGLVAWQDFSIVPGKTFIRVAVSIPSSLLRKDLTPAVRFFSLVLVASVLVVLLVALYVSRYLSRPIVALAAAAIRLAGGELHTEVKVRTTGEVQTLVDSFNQMTQELRETIASRDASMASLVSEIAERKQIEAALKEAKEAAEMATRAKSEFLATMSHELRTPMNGVIGMTGLLLDTPLTAEQREYAETVQRSGQSLLTIINDILDFSKIEAGKLDFEQVDFELRTAVEDVLELLAEQAHDKEIDLAYRIHASVPPWIEGDPGRLRQLLMNLVGNAVKFTETGEVVVQLSLDTETEQDALIRFEVIDTGIGIPADAQHRLFQRFSQVDGSTTRKYGGTGLGLAICKQLVEMMGGTIGVESTLGQGSTFWFVVRLAKRSAPHPLPAALSGMRVLCVDDRPMTREALETLLRDWHIQVDGVADGASALARLRTACQAERLYDLVLLDHQLADMESLALAHTIKADPVLASVRLVLMRAPGQRRGGKETPHAEIAAYLTKPIRQSQLYDCLKTIMGTPAELSPAPLLAPASLTSAPARSSSRVLVAEDNIVNQKVALRLLEKFSTGHFYKSF
jgi:signal transduction histidine kinase/DNA-binding response OmpR family regulator